MTGLVLVVVLITKFLLGAWIAIAAMVVLFVLMRGIRRHYDRVAARAGRRRGRGHRAARRGPTRSCWSRRSTSRRCAPSPTRGRCGPTTLEAVTVSVDPEETRALQDGVGPPADPGPAQGPRLAVPRDHRPGHRLRPQRPAAAARATWSPCSSRSTSSATLIFSEALCFCGKPCVQTSIALISRTTRIVTRPKTSELIMNPTPIIELAGLRIDFGKRRILNDITGALQGRCIGLLGPNGAGKTTLIHTLLGFHKPSSGTARIFGHDIRTNIKEFAPASATCPNATRSSPNQTCVHFVRLMAELSGLPPDAALERAHEALFYVGLGEAAISRARHLLAWDEATGETGAGHRPWAETDFPGRADQWPRSRQRANGCSN